MSKAKPIECKKAFVRNTEQAIPKSVVITEPRPKPVKKPPPKGAKKATCDEPAVKFDHPVRNSSLQLAHKIKTLESTKPKIGKVHTDVDRKQKLAVEEKVSRRVNFPYDQPIYKDLIPLCVKMQTQPMISSREPLPLKDKEPCLSDFFTPRTFSEYSYQVPNQFPNKVCSRRYDGLRLYKIIQNWS